MGKASVEPFPHEGCLAVFVVHDPADGPVVGRVAVGWAVRRGQQTLSPVFKNSRAAKRWAEERFLVGGWTEPGVAPYHQMYAIPKAPR